MKTRIRMLVTAAAAATIAGSTLVGAAPAQAADINVTIPITGTSTLKKQNATLTLPAGAKMTGVLSGDTVTGSMTIPTITAKLRIFGVPTLGDTTSTVKIVETKPAVTKLEVDGSVKVTSTFRLELPKVTSDVLPSVNVVRPTCRTKEISAVLTAAKFDLFTPFALSGTFTIPAFEKCGYSLFGLPSGRDLLMTSLLSGPDNRMDLMAGPVQIG
ncbi:hypothetical protein [Nocardioides speluncae]|uniref:hypothetical protein n=1 Tax=Nocardioides speluncae TaxID=2670337 RepID=UPI000D691534|nr:hypothetical protein [Nocardioides speluncae]